MELSWSTLLLEIINFLILIWILKYFFYAPIQKTISDRKKMVQDKLEHAEKLRDEAQELQLKYNNRLADWQLEKEHMQKDFEQALEQWKSEEVIDFEKKIIAKKEALFAREMRKSKELIEKNAQEALLLAGQFSEKFLKTFADEHLEQKIIEKIILDLDNLPIEKMQLTANVSQQDTILIQSAYTINEQQRQSLIKAIEQLVHKKLRMDFSVNTELFAGLIIQIGSIVLQANLRDELKFFTGVGMNNAIT